MDSERVDRGEGSSTGLGADQILSAMTMASGTRRERWIVDSHTHILPPRLASKIRAVFEAAEGLQGADDNAIRAAAADIAPAPSCCSHVISFDDEEAAIDEQHFANHGHFKMTYHPHDVTLLRRDLAAAGIRSLWVLPYAHKGGGMARKLNTDVAELCRGSLCEATRVSAAENDLVSTGAGPQDDIDEGRDDAMLAMPAMTVHPADGADIVRATTLHALLELGCRAAKLHCSVGSYSILDDALMPFWELADAVRLPVVVHLGASITGHTASRELDDVSALLSQYKRVRFIAAHSASPSTFHAIRLAQRFPNLYLDTTPVVTRAVAYPPRGHALHDTLLDLARQGRVLFGSDVPNVAMPLRDQIAHIFHVFAEKDWKAPAAATPRDIHDSDVPWWQSLDEAQRAGPAVCEVLSRAAQKLYDQVDLDAIRQAARM